MTNKTVIIKEDVDNMAGWVGVIVGEGEDDCGYGKMWEIKFENGDSEFMMECDFDVVS